MRHHNPFRRSQLLGAVAAGAAVAATLVISAGTTIGSATTRLAQNPSEGTTSALSAIPASGVAPLLVNFRASPAVSTAIDFGDGTTGTMVLAPTCARCPSLAVAGHIYQSSGTYTAKLVAGDSTLGSQMIMITVVSRQ